MGAARWILLIALACSSVATGGCATKRKEVYRQTYAASETNPAPAEETVITRETHVVETTDDDAPRGVLSTTVHFVGEILALPFRLVGALFRAIF